MLRRGGTYLLLSSRPPFEVLQFLAVPRVEVTYQPVPVPAAAAAAGLPESMFLYKCLVRKKWKNRSEE